VVSCTPFYGLNNIANKLCENIHILITEYTVYIQFFKGRNFCCFCVLQIIFENKTMKSRFLWSAKNISLKNLHIYDNQYLYIASTTGNVQSPYVRCKDTNWFKSWSGVGEATKSWGAKYVTRIHLQHRYTNPRYLGLVYLCLHGEKWWSYGVTEKVGGGRAIVPFVPLLSLPNISHWTLLIFYCILNNLNGDKLQSSYHLCL